MPATTTEKGEIGEAMVIADLMRQGHDIAIPFGHNQPYDLIVIRKEDGRLEKVQVKYTTSDGRVVIVRVESSSAWVRHRYTPEEIDWVAAFESTTGQCFYLPPSCGAVSVGSISVLCHRQTVNEEESDSLRSSESSDRCIRWSWTDASPTIGVPPE
ncbi:MAG: group I intron-associated PD-(D/E)XK endonuclease [Acidimicrobiia bacterium]|jgi:hypothetical protein